ncbi:hypothetical protein [Brevundimonas sp. PAMC22021]|uniref:hypothetical protein n=1 Tax=Brevundimonas sp. PAMC22021 TaxID=2861285 RepID=UPI001C6287B8|nr:hypothetical protein [Brevundimonas sp. PAMC22021]QYF86998.1 hypothetical protein KY493_00250 [Brevundimonas sp. PAMC22021]
MIHQSTLSADVAPSGPRPRFTARYAVLLATVLLATFVVHEAAHWAMGTLLGHQMSYGLNGSVPSAATPPQDHALISTAGPAVTVLQALIALAFVRAKRSVNAYAVLYAAAFMRVVAQGLSFILPNDEARVSAWLGIGFWTLPILLALALVACTIWASRRLRLSWRFNAMAYLVSSLAVSAIVGADMVIGH